MKHNYPKNRKPNPNSTTQMLLNKYSEQELYKMWVKYNGMYKMSEYLTHEIGLFVSPYVCRFLTNKFNWVRTIKDKNLPIYMGVLNGRVKPEYYSHISFQ